MNASTRPPWLSASRQLKCRPGLVAMWWMRGHARKTYVGSASHHIPLSAGVGACGPFDGVPLRCSSPVGAMFGAAAVTACALFGVALGCSREALVEAHAAVPSAGHLGVSSARGGPVGEPLVDDVAGPANGVRAQPEGLGECAIGPPSTQRASADADSVKHVGNAQHGFSGHSR